MPREDRRIIFEFGEVYKALYAMCAQKQVERPPPGRIVSVSEGEGEDRQIRLALEDPHHGENKTLEYSRDFLAAALMLFCKGHGIPLPKHARKSVDIEADNVTLRVEM